MELPVELVAVLSALIGMIVAEGLQSLSRLLDRDLSGHATALTAALVALAVSVANGLLVLIPAQYAQLAQGFLAFLVIVLGPMALHSFLTRRSQTVVIEPEMEIAVENVEVKS